jgi:hypothetical protein
LPGENFGSQATFALARYDRNGTLDPGFGSGGKVTTDFALARYLVADGPLDLPGHGPLRLGRRYEARGDATAGVAQEESWSIAR